MIPDKIYVHTGAHLGELTLTAIKVDAPDEQEYIRKDKVLGILENSKHLADAASKIDEI